MISFLRRYVFHNFLLKLMALIIAVLLWVAVNNEPTSEIAITVPIEFQHVPQGLEITSERIPEAQVRVSGPGRVVRSLAPSDVHAILDLTGARPGERTYDLVPRQIRVPAELEVVQVEPSRLHMEFDRRVSKQVPVRPRVAGVTGVEASADPAVAIIVGPEKHVQHIDEVTTDAVDATGVTGQSTFTGIHLYVADPMVRIERPAVVNVTVTTDSDNSH
jgi:YbbR domain-containing protein